MPTFAEKTLMTLAQWINGVEGAWKKVVNAALFGCAGAPPYRSNLGEDRGMPGISRTPCLECLLVGMAMVERHQPVHRLTGQIVSSLPVFSHRGSSSVFPCAAGRASPATSRRSARLMCVSMVETEMFILSATCAGGNPSIRRK